MKKSNHCGDDCECSEENKFNSHPSPKYQGEELVEATVSTDGLGDNQAEICLCLHPRNYHFSMISEDSLCHHKNKKGYYDCPCKSFSPLEPERLGSGQQITTPLRTSETLMRSVSDGDKTPEVHSEDCEGCEMCLNPNYTPQTKPNIDNKISTSDVKNMTGDKTAEIEITKFYDLILKIRRKLTREELTALEQGIKAVEKEAKEEMLEAVESMDEKWEQLIIEHCDFVLEEEGSRGYNQGFADMEKVILKGFENRKIKLTEMKEELK